MKPVFIIAGNQHDYSYCKQALEIPEAIYLTTPSQLDGIHDFTLIKAGNYFKSDERVKLAEYAEARVEENRIVKEAAEEEHERKELEGS